MPKDFTSTLKGLDVPSKTSKVKPIEHDSDGMYLVKEVGDHQFDVYQKSSGVVVASAATKVTANTAAAAINACAIVPRMKS